MSNVTRMNPGVFNAASFAAAATNTDFENARPKVSSGGIPFLKMNTEDGEWEFGQESIQAPEDAVWGVFPQTFAQGYVAWKGRKLVAKAMSFIGQPPIHANDLPPIPATQRGWEPCVAVGLVCVECQSDPSIEGTVVIFESSSNGGLQAWSTLFDKIRARAQTGKEDFAAVVSLQSTSYEHDEWGTVFKPIFKLDSWDEPAQLASEYEVPAIELSRDPEPVAGEEPTQKPARRGRNTVAKDEDHGQSEPVIDQAPVEDAEVVEETPAPRRRRRTAATADE